METQRRLVSQIIACMPLLTVSYVRKTVESLYYLEGLDRRFNVVSDGTCTYTVACVLNVRKLRKKTGCSILSKACGKKL